MSCLIDTNKNHLEYYLKSKFLNFFNHGDC
jgi:hypothetical protein